MDTQRAASDSRMDMFGGESPTFELVGQKLTGDTGQVNLIQEVVDMSESGEKELESADPEFFLEVESQLQETCDNLAMLIIKKFNQGTYAAQLTCCPSSSCIC